MSLQIKYETGMKSWMSRGLMEGGEFWGKSVVPEGQTASKNEVLVECVTAGEHTKDKGISINTLIYQGA